MAKPEDKVKFAGKNAFGQSCFQYMPDGKRYCGNKARERAIKQGYAKQNSVNKFLDGTTPS